MIDSAKAKEYMLEHLNQWVRLRKESGMVPKGYAYSCGEDFVLQHGVWYDPQPFPKGIPQGLPKKCFANSLSLAAQRGLRYVEGYASGWIDGGDFFFPVQHGWNLDADGKLIDSTWLNQGIVYIGVEFSAERADDAMWEGDTNVLCDWKRCCPLFKQPWKGETPENAIPESERLRLWRAHKLGELWQLVGKEVEESEESCEQP